MTRSRRVGWKAVRVLGPGTSGDLLLGAERLAALYRFQSGGPSPGHRFFVDGQRDTELGDPEQVDWADFPVVAALEAVTYDELRRLRMLLSDAEPSHGRAPAIDLPPTPPRGLAWGVDLHTGAPSGDV